MSIEARKPVSRPFSLSISLRIGGRRLRWRFNGRQLLSRSLFASAAMLMLVGCYCMSILPVAMLLSITGLMDIPLVEQIYTVVYAPIFFAGENFEWVANFYQRYEELVIYLFNLF